MLPKISSGIYEQVQSQIIHKEREKQWDQRHHIGTNIPEVQSMKKLDQYIQEFNKNKETLNNSILFATATATGRPYTQKLSFSPIKNRKGTSQQTPFSMKSYRNPLDSTNILPNTIELETINTKSDTNFFSYVKKNQELEERSQELLIRINDLFKQLQFEPFHSEYFNYFIQQQSTQEMYEILKREINLMESKQSPYQLVVAMITEREKSLRSLIDGVEQIDSSSEQEENNPKVLQIFQKMSQLREYTIQVIERITAWRKSLMSISAAAQQVHSPRIDLVQLTFFFAQDNYLLKLYSDSSFISKSSLANQIPLSTKHDPFLIYPTQLVLQNASTNPVFISSFDLSEDLRNRILKVEKVLINEITYDNDIKDEKNNINFINRSVSSSKEQGINRQEGFRIDNKGKNITPFSRYVGRVHEVNGNKHDQFHRLNKSENKISSYNHPEYDNGRGKPIGTIVFKKVKGNLKVINNKAVNTQQVESLPQLQLGYTLKVGGVAKNRIATQSIDKSRGKSENDLRRLSRDFIQINRDMTALLRKKRDSKLYDSIPADIPEIKEQQVQQVKQPKLDRDCCTQIQEIQDKGYYTKILTDQEEPYYMRLGTSTSLRKLRKSNSSSPSKGKIYSLQQTQFNTKNNFYNDQDNNKSPKDDQLPAKKVIRFFNLDDEIKEKRESDRIGQDQQEIKDEKTPYNTHNIIVLGKVEDKQHNNQNASLINSQKEENENKVTPIKSIRLSSILPNKEGKSNKEYSNKKDDISIREQDGIRTEQSASKEYTSNKESGQNYGGKQSNEINLSMQSQSRMTQKDSSFMYLKEEDSSNILPLKHVQSQSALPDTNSRQQGEDNDDDQLPQTHSDMLQIKKKSPPPRTPQLSRNNQVSPICKRISTKKADPLDKDQKSNMTTENKLNHNNSQSSLQQSQQVQKFGAYKYIRQKLSGQVSKTGVYQKKGQSKASSLLQEQEEQGLTDTKLEGDKMHKSLVLNRQSTQPIDERNQGQQDIKPVQSEKQQKSSLKKAALALIKIKQEEKKAILEAAQKQKDYEKELKNNHEFNNFLRREQEQKLQNIEQSDLDEAFTNTRQNPYNTNGFKVSIQVIPKCLKEEDVNEIIHNYFKKIHPFFTGLFMRDAFTLIYQLKNDINFNFLQAIDRRTQKVLGLLIVHPYFDYGQQKGPFDFFDDPPPKEADNNPLSDEENFLNEEEGERGEDNYDNGDDNNTFWQSTNSQQNLNSSFFSSKTTFRQQNKLLGKCKNQQRKIMIIDHFSCIDISMFKGLYSLFTEYIWAHDTADSIEVKLYTSPQLMPLQERIEQMITAANFTYSKSLQDGTQRVYASIRDEEKYPIDEALLGDGLSAKSPEQLYFNSLIMISKQEIPENRIFNKSLYVDNGQRFNFLCALSHLFKEMYISEVLQKLADENQHEKIRQLYQLAFTMRQNIRKKKIFSDLFNNQEFDNIEKMNIVIESMSLLPTFEYDDNPNNKIHMNTFSLKLNIPHACHTIMTNQQDEKVLYIRIANNSSQIDSSMASTSNSTPLVSALVYSRATTSPMIQIQTIDTKYTLFYLQAEDFFEKDHQDLHLYIYEFFKQQDEKEATYKTIWLPQFQINYPHIRNDDFDAVLSKNRVFSSLNFSFKLPDFIGGKLLYQEPSRQKSVFVKPPFIFGVIDNQFDIHMPNQPLFSCLIDEKDVLYFNEEKTNQCLLFIDKEVDDGPIQGYPKITGIQNNIERSNQSKNLTSKTLHQEYHHKVIDQQNRHNY